MHPQRPGYGSHGLSPRRRRQSLPPIPDPTATVVVLRLPDAPTAFSSAVAPSTAPPGTTGKSVGRWPDVRACSTAHADADIRSAFLSCQLPQLFSQLHVMVRSRLITITAAVQLHEPASPTFAQGKLLRRKRRVL